MYLACDPQVENRCSLMRKGPIDFNWEMELCPGLWQERLPDSRERQGYRRRA